MKLTSEVLRELHQKETARSSRLRDSDCLPAEMLTSAAAGELRDAQRDAVVDHLTACSSCAQEYSEIRSLKTWAESNAQVFAEAQVDAGPARVLRLPERRVPVQQPFGRRLAGSRLLSFYVPCALAAMFLIAALVLGVQLMSQRNENDRLVAQVNEKQLATAEANRRAEQAETARRMAQEELARRPAEKPPQQTGEAGVPNGPGQTKERSESPSVAEQPTVNVPIFELEPRGATRNSGSDVVTFEAASDTRLITLILHVNGELSQDNYSLEVLDAAGRPVWSSRGLRKNRYSNFTVALPRRTFPAGDYRLKLYSSRDSRRELVEEYAMRLQYR